jgi:hypothetical protein
VTDHYDPRPGGLRRPLARRRHQLREVHATTDNDSQAETHRAHNDAAATKAARGRRVVADTACGPDPAGGGPVAVDSVGTIGAGLYDPADLDRLPAEAVAGSIGCANPVARAQLRPGEDVLDLGSGGGIDVLISARRIAPRGRAYGVVEFLEGRIEAVAVPDHSVDVVVITSPPTSPLSSPRCTASSVLEAASPSATSSPTPASIRTRPGSSQLKVACWGRPRPSPSVRWCCSGGVAAARA